MLEGKCEIYTNSRGKMSLQKRLRNHTRRRISNLMLTPPLQLSPLNYFLLYLFLRQNNNLLLVFVRSPKMYVLYHNDMIRYYQHGHVHVTLQRC